LRAAVSSTSAPKPSSPARSGPTHRGRCNCLKGQLTEAEFRELPTFLALLHPIARQDLEHRLLAGGKRYGASRKGGGL
jgi:hypothetical protein